ncbi:tRNA1(Val) (adenine(37)-N6)-methyltransferase [Desulfobacula toluolica]|uniref:Putative RNA methylase n=1 Tax=Desulfobacula toluolica (strain DSM 7467 / Tol2) TaxID=651182 RepID=K0NEK9_DESTT|nr:methyltransferase [Desulfobacula toluolica]CCK79506.1 putative RNA methylase [Desulfobacula toluolica Tol2]
MEKSSAESFFDNGIKVSQPENGYRFSMDPFILAAHIQLTDTKHLLDVGCGCGIMPLILAYRHSAIRITGIEIQEELSFCARQNSINHKLDKTISIINKDIKNILISDINGKADIIISNPPYKKKNSGRLNPNTQKAIARHEITLDIDMLFKCSSRLINEQGRVYIIFPAERISDLILAMESYKFSPVYLRFVHIKKNTGARRVILCAAKNNKKTCTVSPPLYIYNSENKLTNEYISMFKP